MDKEILTIDHLEISLKKYTSIIDRFEIEGKLGSFKKLILFDVQNTVLTSKLVLEDEIDLIVEQLNQNINNNHKNKQTFD